MLKLIDDNVFKLNNSINRLWEKLDFFTDISSLRFSRVFSDNFSLKNIYTYTTYFSPDVFPVSLVTIFLVKIFILIRHFSHSFIFSLVFNDLPWVYITP